MTVGKRLGLLFLASSPKEYAARGPLFCTGPSLQCYGLNVPGMKPSKFTNVLVDLC